MPAVTLPAKFDSSQVDNGSNGTATPNLMPDWIGKVAYDGNIAGMPFHADAAGLLREFKINTFLPAVGTSTDAHATGYGGSINFNIGVLPHLQLIGSFYASNGAGREISTGVAPDFIVTAPDASGNYHIQTVNSYAAVAGFEWDCLSHDQVVRLLWSNLHRPGVFPIIRRHLRRVRISWVIQLQQ
jgi:hypothetical protein